MNAVRRDAVTTSPIVVSLPRAPGSGSALGLGARLTAVAPPWLLSRILTATASDGPDTLPAGHWHGPEVRQGLLTATTAPANASAIRWVHHVMGELHRQLTWLDGPPVVVVAGPPEYLDSVRWPRFEAPARRAATAGPARYRRTLRDGLERHLVSFPDHSAPAGLGSTELALHLAANGPRSLVDSTFQEFGIHAGTAIQRSFASEGARLRWSILAQRPTGIAALETAVAAVGGYLAGPALSPPEHVRQTAVDSVRTRFGTVTELVREMVHYELTGWSPELLLRPERELQAVGAAELGHSLDQLVQPVLQVIGASRP